MSRVGRNPITLPAGVQVRFEHGVVTVKGPKGELSQPVASDKIEIKIEGNVLTMTGTPTKADAYQFTVVAANCNGNSVVGKQVTVVINEE